MFGFKSKKESSGVFRRVGTEYKEVTDKIKDMSLNGIAIHLGYHPDQLKFYFGHFDAEADIQQVGFEIFTDRIVFILVKQRVTEIDTRKLKRFLENYDVEKEFDSVTTRDILQAGIENKSLSIQFLTQVLGLEINDLDGGIVHSSRLGLILYFSGGVLTDFQSADGLNEWAKYLRDLNESLFNSYVEVAQKYWGENRGMIEQEVNLQGESLANTPNGIRNEFVKKHKAEEDTINFLMLLVCHYGQKITAEHFMRINFGRYTPSKTAPNGTLAFKYNSFTLRFSAGGDLIDIVE